MRRFRFFATCGALAVTVVGTAPTLRAQQIDDAAAIIALNSRVLHQLILERDPTLFREVALEQFVVVAPGGRVENKEQSADGARAFNASRIELSDEQVSFDGGTAVLVGRLRIHGTMQPVGELPPMKFLAVFVRKADGWRMLARSLTPCMPIAIERGVC